MRGQLGGGGRPCENQGDRVGFRVYADFVLGCFVLSGRVYVNLNVNVGKGVVLELYAGQGSIFDVF